MHVSKPQPAVYSVSSDGLSRAAEKQQMYVYVSVRVAVRVAVHDLHSRCSCWFPKTILMHNVVRKLVYDISVIIRVHAVHTCLACIPLTS